MSETEPRGFRDRKRDLVRAELIAVAQDLFVEQGYDETTVEQIATSVGMSERTFFRYFPSKEALILGKYDDFGEALRARLLARPADEPIWEALRRMFDYVVDYSAEHGHRMREMDRIVGTHESLRGAYLERMDRVQTAITDAVADRLSAASHRPADSAALAAAAFACVATANRAAAATGIPLPTAIDDAMNAVARHSGGEVRGV